MTQSGKDDGADAERVFAEFIELGDGAKDSDFERLCANHPDLEPDLRRLHAAWRDLSGVLARASHTLSVGRRLAASVDTDVDPGITLEPEEGDEADTSSSNLLERLANHTPSASRFRLKGEIARGGMGAILRAWDEDLRRHVAIKVILGKASKAASGETPEVEPGSLGRFLEEAQVTGQLEHPGIVPVHELGLDASGRVFFAMRLVKGRTLTEVFDMVRTGEEGWNQPRALGIVLRACEAMAFAHSKQVVHRDLKPANVMVGSFGETYVMDWGLARVLGREDTKDLRIPAPQKSTMTAVSPDARQATPRRTGEPLVTEDGTVMGTPAYMPPEQAEGRIEDVGPPSDVYSMGAILYHLLSGQMPYVSRGSRPSPHTILAMVIQGPPKPVRQLDPSVAAELEAICEKAMARNIEARYPTMIDLARDLRAFLEHRVVTAYESGAIAELRKWVARNKGIAATAAAALVVIAVLSIWSFHRIQGERDTAFDERDRADRERDRVLRVSDAKRLGNLMARVDDLWPVHPRMARQMRDWLDDAATLLRRQPGHEATLAELRAKGTPLVHPLETKLAELEALREGPSEINRNQLQRAIGGLRTEIDRTRDHDFGNDAESSWWHDTVRDLVVGLAALSADDPYGKTVKSVEERLTFAESVHRRSIEDHLEEWADAIAAISNVTLCPRYGGLRITEQLGLVPIDRDPQSGLWEFWHIQTGERPERSKDGELVVTAEMGLVFVLIPGRTFHMGSQARDREGPNFDPQATENEADPAGMPMQVELDPFFLSKYEMMQGQWLRFTGSNPSRYPPGWVFGDKESTLENPVERVTWMECVTVLGRMELLLPTEAQWEYAGRAGTETPWWTGSDSFELDRAGNLADAYCRNHGGADAWPYDLELNDGHTIHAPVGTYLENGFGLFDTIGNVCEWCLDGYGSYQTEPRKGDGYLDVKNPSYRILRGGTFDYSSVRARSAYRYGFEPTSRGASLGVRPARQLGT